MGLFGKSAKKKEIQKAREEDEKIEVENLTKEEIASSKNIIELYKHKVRERDEYLTKKYVKASNAVNVDIMNITEEIMKDFEEFKVDFIRMINDSEPCIRVAACLHCLRAQVAVEPAITELRKISQDDRNGRSMNEASAICTLIKKKKIPPFKFDN